ncbi:T9SS-dependent M36 family metallopeptidase [Lacinutrix sp. MedPE-SW]|uniref:T9SS-dependent M36 family metallopeptidase n=1 Tax=Lacinutrix sp. MedPE-SW TaxID=1860087 RepID=UPI0009135A1C|nr:T9SS-dependent M36 family metallopeptidase [Lacinutrix sp. MedPE-SW]OIQ23261.1 MAG: peptidase [Lacinutrix sp. MedPE-SW]
MKKNYTYSLYSFILLFFLQFSYGQEALSDNAYGSIIEKWLSSEINKYGLQETDVLDIQISDAYYSDKTKINHVYLNQAYQGIKIHNAISSTAIKDNRVFYYANAFISNLASKINTTNPLLNPEAAISSVVSQFNLGTITSLELISTGHNKYIYTNGGISKADIPVELVYQKTEEGNLNLAWDLSIKTNNGKNWYSIRVDAVSGEVIDVLDWIVSCNFGEAGHVHHEINIADKTENFNLFKPEVSMMPDGSQYNVFPIPVESPNHGSIQLVTDPSNIIASPFGWHDTDGVAGAEFTITRGNNVYAQEDANGDDGTGYSSDGGATLNFNFPFNPNQEPLGYQDVSLTNLFYTNNVMHDIWYQYGFNEVSGNFQANNYGNGGVSGDFVFADGQDGSGLNNATFGTPPDGGNPVMTMFLWSAVGQEQPPLTINNSSVAGTYSAPSATFGGALPPTPIVSDLVLVVDDNASASTDANDACDTIINASEIAGNIAILRRGSCEFGAKVLAAENAGAVAVIVVNNVSTPPIEMGPGAVGDQVTIPSVMVSFLDGDAMINAILNGETVNASLVAAPPFQRDGSLDNVIVAHEYGHGISSRLAGGPANTGCLTNAEQMGEGWSDWFGLMITMKSTDLGTDARGIGTYATTQPVDGQGIRPFPYSTDTTTNPLTYADTNNTAAISQPHGIGTVWGTVLWDLTWKYIEKYGFDPDIYNGTGGNNKIMQLVLDGLKLQVCGAGFVDGRDGLLAADLATTGGEDQCLIWEVFAARGLGVNASQGTFGSRTDQVEDFTMPDPAMPSLQNCTSLSVSEFNLASQYSIYPNPANNEINISSKKNFGEVVVTLTDINGRQVLTQTVELKDSVNVNIDALQSGMYILTIKGENIITNDKIIKN